MSEINQPPIISVAPKRKWKTPLMTFFALALMAAAFFYAILPHPPKEKEILATFRRHRAEFEELHRMLKDDTNLRRVGSWGVHTADPHYIGAASGSTIPVERYNRYMALLDKIGGKVASRSEGKLCETSIVIWTWGWAGDSHHVGISWMDEPPPDIVPSIDHRKRKEIIGRQTFCQQIEGNWYMWTDL